VGEDESGGTYVPGCAGRDFPDLPTNSWFDYAANEGIARAFDLFDRHGVKASSFMTGMSFERYPHSWTGQADLFTPRLDVTDQVQ
jgi:peptidoglycan/xylan/chitin deacetylase (PgdA/CDA1 family)